MTLEPTPGPSLPSAPNPTRPRETILIHTWSAEWISTIQRFLTAGTSPRNWRLDWALDLEEIESLLPFHRRALVVIEIGDSTVERESRRVAQWAGEGALEDQLVIAVANRLRPIQRHSLAMGGFAAVLDSHAATPRLASIARRHFDRMPERGASIEQTVAENLPWHRHRSTSR